MVSPIDGVVVRRDADPGATIRAGQSFVAVADLDHTRIEAEVDELDGRREERVLVKIIGE